MIKLLALLFLTAQTPAPVEVSEPQRVVVRDCLARGKQLVSLLDALDRPADDVASAAIAKEVQADCSRAVTELGDTEWGQACRLFLTRHAEVATAMADIFEGRRDRDETPGFIYPGWQDGAVRCGQISGLLEDL